MGCRMKKYTPDLWWAEEFDRAARAQGWSLFETGPGQAEIQKLDEDDLSGSDADAVWSAYQAALRHEPHAMAAFTITLRRSLKKQKLSEANK